MAAPASLDGGAAEPVQLDPGRTAGVPGAATCRPQAYSPSGLASGDGSATIAAIDAYAQALQQKTNPPKKTQLPKAISPRSRDWAASAFTALQKIKAGGITTDQVTVVVRDRNVLVTVVVEGRFGPRRVQRVPVSQLTAGAAAAARDVLSHASAEPERTGRSHRPPG